MLKSTFATMLVLIASATLAMANEKGSLAHCKPEEILHLKVGQWGPGYQPAISNAAPSVAAMEGLPEKECLDIEYKYYDKTTTLLIAILKGEIDTVISSIVIPGITDAGLHATILGTLNLRADFAYGGRGTERQPLAAMLGKTLLLRRCAPRPGDVNYTPSAEEANPSFPDVLFRLRIEQAIQEGELPANTQVICSSEYSDKKLITSKHMILIKTSTEGSAGRIRIICEDERVLTTYFQEEEGIICENGNGKMVNYINPGELAPFPTDQAIYIKEHLDADPMLMRAATRYEQVLMKAVTLILKDPKGMLQKLATAYPDSPIGKSVARGDLTKLTEAAPTILQNGCPRKEDFAEYIRIYSLEDQEESFFAFLPCEGMQ